MADKFKDAMAGIDMDGMKGAADAMLKKINPLFEKIQSEQLKLTKPKSKKNTEWNTDKISVSLIEDGRVIINFSTIDQATEFYDTFEQLKPLNRLGKFLRKCQLI